MYDSTVMQDTLPRDLLRAQRNEALSARCQALKPSKEIALCHLARDRITKCRETGLSVS